MLALAHCGGNVNRRSLLRTSLLFGSAARAFSDSRTESSDAETQYGKVRGVSRNGVTVFRAIPYGGATEGGARFLPPAKPAKWSAVREATETGPRCVQGAGNIFLSPIIGEY